MTYMIGTGWNNTAGYGTPDPQPKCPGLRWGRRTMAGDRFEYEDGYASTVWQFGYMTGTQMSSFHALCGLGEGTPSARVTVRSTGRTSRTFYDYNATILAPDYGSGSSDYSFGVYQDVQYRIVGMDEI